MPKEVLYKIWFLAKNNFSKQWTKYKDLLILVILIILMFMIFTDLIFCKTIIL